MIKKILTITISILLLTCLFACNKKQEVEKDGTVGYVPTSSGAFFDKASGDWKGDGNGYLMQISVDTNSSNGKNYYRINIFGEDEGYPFYYMVGENTDTGIAYKYGHKIIKDKDGIEVTEYGDDRGQFLIDGDKITWKSSIRDIEVKFGK